MTIEKMTRGQIKNLRDDINGALIDLGLKHGLKINAGNASFTDNSVTFKVECLIAGFDKGKDEFERSAFLFNLSQADYGKDFSYGGRQYKLVGLKPRSPKYPIIGERDGGRYKLPERAVAALAS